MIKKHLFALHTLLFVAWIATSWPSSLAYAQESTADFMQLSLQELMDADVQAVNVLGTHTHLAGEWMLGYRYMSMHMEGNRDGTKDIGVNRVLQDFRVSPTDMTMEMHMAEVMYAPTDNLTLVVMFPYLRVSMDHITRIGTRFTTEAEGLGDISVRALYTLLGDVRKDRHRLLFNAGLSFPTGGIDEKDGTPAGPDQKLPYPMQLGSDTFDLLPGLVYLGEAQNWSWGGELIPTINTSCDIPIA